MPRNGILQYLGIGFSATAMTTPIGGTGSRTATTTTQPLASLLSPPSGRVPIRPSCSRRTSPVPKMQRRLFLSTSNRTASCPLAVLPLTQSREGIVNCQLPIVKSTPDRHLTLHFPLQPRKNKTTKETTLPVIRPRISESRSEHRPSTSSLISPHQPASSPVPSSSNSSCRPLTLLLLSFLPPLLQYLPSLPLDPTPVRPPSWPAT